MCECVNVRVYEERERERYLTMLSTLTSKKLEREKKGANSTGGRRVIFESRDVDDARDQSIDPRPRADVRRGQGKFCVTREKVKKKRRNFCVTRCRSARNGRGKVRKPFCY